MKPTLLITVDTEALPARASEEHVERLIWGRHPKGTAGIAEICDIVESCGGIALFFLEVADSINNLAAYREINSYLTRRGHLVEWHYHPEILGKKFWRKHGASGDTIRQDLFDASDAGIILDFGLEQFRKITGKMPMAYRAGSFRWNQQTINFLAQHNIPFSFNACAETAVKDNFDTYRPESPHPFAWNNGVIEVPCGEIVMNGEIIHFRYPRSFPRKIGPEVLARNIAEESSGVVQILLHSWSFLDKDKNGFYVYRSDKRKRYFHKILQSLTKKFELPSNIRKYLSRIGCLT